jgi:hypothetical protein
VPTDCFDVTYRKRIFETLPYTATRSELGVTCSCDSEESSGHTRPIVVGNPLDPFTGKDPTVGGNRLYYVDSSRRYTVSLTTKPAQQTLGGNSHSQDNTTTNQLLAYRHNRTNYTPTKLTKRRSISFSLLLVLAGIVVNET